MAQTAAGAAFLPALAGNQLIDVLRPQLEGRRLFLRVDCSIVNTGNPGLVARYVVEHCLHDVRMDAELVGHTSGNGPADIVQPPRPNSGRFLIERGFRFRPALKACFPRVAAVASRPTAENNIATVAHGRLLFATSRGD
jgi:hypothetical protein